MASTPAAGFVRPIASTLIGMGAGVICYTACMMKAKFVFDDSIDVVGIHGVAGTFGALGTGIFASKAVNAAGVQVLLYGNPGDLVIQAGAVAVSVLFASVETCLILKIGETVVGLPVLEEEERMGLDLSQSEEMACS